MKMRKNMIVTFAIIVAFCSSIYAESMFQDGPANIPYFTFINGRLVNIGEKTVSHFTINFPIFKYVGSFAPGDSINLPYAYAQVLYTKKNLQGADVKVYEEVGSKDIMSMVGGGGQQFDIFDQNNPTRLSWNEDTGFLTVETHFLASTIMLISESPYFLQYQLPITEGVRVFGQFSFAAIKKAHFKLDFLEAKPFYTVYILIITENSPQIVTYSIVPHRNDRIQTTGGAK